MLHITKEKLYSERGKKAAKEKCENVYFYGGDDSMNERVNCFLELKFYFVKIVEISIRFFFFFESENYPNYLVLISNFR